MKERKKEKCRRQNTVRIRAIEEDKLRQMSKFQGTARRFCRTDFMLFDLEDVNPRWQMAIIKKN